MTLKISRHPIGKGSEKQNFVYYCTDGNMPIALKQLNTTTTAHSEHLQTSQECCIITRKWETTYEFEIKAASNLNNDLIFK